MNAIKQKTLSERSRGDKIFFWALMIWPIIQFSIFVIYVNLDSFPLAFQKYDVDTKKYYFGDLLVNYKRFFGEFTASTEIGKGLLRNLIIYVLSLVINIPMAMYFSFVVYKKAPGFKAMKVLLYAPTVISATVWVLIYSQTLENAIPAISEQIFGVQIRGLLSNTETTFPALIFYGIWNGVGGSTLLYISAMCGVPEEQSESMRIDGANYLQEFIHLTIPGIWPFLSLMLYNGVKSLLTNDFHLYTFYGENAPTHVRTYGYWIAVRKLRASSNVFDLPYVAAIGLLESAILIPLMFAVKKMLSKLGPKTED